MTSEAVPSGKRYKGKVKPDYYGRIAPEHAHGTGNIDRWTNSTRRVMDVMMALYDRIIDPDLSVRRITVVAANLIPEDEIPPEAPEQLSLFADYDALEKKRKKEANRLLPTPMSITALTLPSTASDPYRPVFPYISIM